MNSIPQTIVRYVRGVVPRGVQIMSDDNSGSTIELNRRRVLGALGTVGVASAGAGAGTFALFSDTETSSGNSVQAGTMDLTATGQNGDTFGDASLTVGPIKPGQTKGPYTITLSNTGNIGGTLDFALAGFNDEGTDTEAETDTSGDGDLGEVLEVTFDVGGNSVTGTFNEVFNQIYENVYDLDGNSSVDATLQCTLPSGAGNDVQGDIVTANFTAFLGQQANQTPGQKFDVNAIKGTPGSGTVRVIGGLAQIDTSTFDDPASQWVGTENIGFWFGTGSDSTDTTDKVELKYSPNNGWFLPNNDTAASLSDFSFGLDGEVFTVGFDDSTYTEFGLYVEPENQEGNGSEQAVATPDDGKPWATDLYDL